VLSAIFSANGSMTGDRAFVEGLLPPRSAPSSSSP
jgi:hypothetical protein